MYKLYQVADKKGDFFEKEFIDDFETVAELVDHMNWMVEEEEVDEDWLLVDPPLRAALRREALDELTKLSEELGLPD